MEHKIYEVKYEEISKNDLSLANESVLKVVKDDLDFYFLSI